MMLNVTSLTWEPATRQDSGCDSAHAQQSKMAILLFDTKYG